MDMVSVFVLFITMGLVPIILGLPWVKVFNPKHEYCFAYSSGFFIMLAIFEILSVPVILGYGTFKTIVILYSIGLVFCCGVSLWYIQKNKLVKRKKIDKLQWTEWIYLFGFLGIIGVQIVRGFTYDITYMSYDDVVYTAIAADAYAGNGLINIDLYKGTGNVLFTKYALASWNIYPAYFATMSGINVATIAHTVQYIQLIILAYSTYWFLAGEIVKKRDNQLVFILITALFYWFGYHSHYSLTFRLLGPNYQGKAVLAVSLTPFNFSVSNYDHSK